MNYETYFIHQKSGPGHVSGIFENSDAKEKNQDVGQEYDDAADTCDDPFQEQVFYQGIGQDAVHQHGKTTDTGLYPRHGVFTKGKGRLKHNPDKQNKDGKSHKPVRQDQVNVSRYVHALLNCGGMHLLDNSGNKTVAFIRR